jgi:hypothetical protein
MHVPVNARRTHQDRLHIGRIAERPPGGIVGLFPREVLLLLALSFHFQIGT